MLKNILIHLDSSKTCASRLETAIALAKKSDAHLTGVYVVTHPEIPPFIQAGISVDIIETQVREAAEIGSKCIEEFKSKVSAAGLQFESRMVEGTVADALTDHGRYFDLLVVGQFDPDDSGLYAIDDMPDRLIMSAGRPILVVPYAGSFSNVGDNVIVSWDASRQATRAVNDAMSILESAKRVDVLSINPGDKGLGDAPGADICLHMARHGVNATAQHITVSDIGAADMLLSRAADSSADMIVMGAYGHARWREIALGGFTRHMLAHMTVPVLMAN
jgi:nucleotide-binding universal stress UspA family protein